MSTNPDSTFAQRLEKACEHAKVDYRPTAIGNLFDPPVMKQTVATWMAGSVPRAEQLFELADKLGVDPRWLATGKGDMVQKVLLNPSEDAFTPSALAIARTYDDLVEPAREHVRQQLKFLLAAQVNGASPDAMQYETSRVRKSTAGHGIGQRAKKTRLRKR